MITEEDKIENRILKFRKIFNNLESVIDRLPDSFPSAIKDMLKKHLIGNKELKEMMDQFDHNRPPRIFVMGRTGIGKSSLINALCGGYVADVSDVNSGTVETNMYTCTDNDRVLMDIMDSRGTAESDPIKEQSAEEQLKNDIIGFDPDVALLVMDCSDRSASLDKDLEFMNNVRKEYYNKKGSELQVVIALNKADRVQPVREQDPKNYSEKKMYYIKANTNRYIKQIEKHDIKVQSVIPVSSLIDWSLGDDEDAEELTHEEIKDLPSEDVKRLKISFDGRYNIDELRDALENAIEDYEARMGLRMAFKLEELVVNLAKQVNRIICSVAAGVAITPIPVSDMSVLICLQALDVMIIASLGGEDISLDSARKFVFSMGGIGAAGFVFRMTAQQLTKLANAIFPAAGSVISSGIAAGGTNLIGQAAISYYIKGNDLSEAKKKIKKKIKSPDKDKNRETDVKINETVFEQEYREVHSAPQPNPGVSQNNTGYNNTTTNTYTDTQGTPYNN